jgi:hypothetical protein
MPIFGRATKLSKKSTGLCSFGTEHAETEFPNSVRPPPPHPVRREGGLKADTRAIEG